MICTEGLSAEGRCESLIQKFNNSKADFELICSSIQSKMENIEILDNEIIEESIWV